MARKIHLMLMALFLSLLMNCGNDADDGNDDAGGSGGEKVDSGAKNDAGEAADDGLPNGGDGGRDAADDGLPNGGDDAGSLAVCLEKMSDFFAAPEECETCICEHCSNEVAECADDEGCTSIVNCVRDTACSSGSDCYMPDTCREVIDEVGVGTRSNSMSFELGKCTEGAGCSCPWIADTDAGGTFTISGTVSESVTWEAVSRGEEALTIEGVEVCVFEDDALCATTDADGTYTLEDAPANTEFYISYTKDGYRPQIRCITPRSEELTISDAMVSNEMAKKLAESVGASYPDDATGGLTFWAATQNDDESDSIFVTEDGKWRMLAGVSFSLEPESGVGPFYENADEQFDSSLSETDEAGFGAFFNVEPGEYTLSASHPTLNCMLVSGMQVAPEKLRIDAGYSTAAIGAVCM